jgi:hypothetical protein
MKMISKFKMALRSSWQILDMTRRDHLNYLRSQLIKAKRWLKPSNLHEHGMVTFLVR